MQREAFSLVFSHGRYAALAVGIFGGLFMVLSYMSQFIFFEPKILFYVPQQGVLNFSLIVAVASLSGIVTSLSIYRIRQFGEGIRKSSGGFLGTLVGAGAGACSCSSIGFAAASAAGSIGGTATAFLTQYETPLRIVAIAILGYTYFVATRDISLRCKIEK